MKKNPFKPNLFIMHKDHDLTSAEQLLRRSLIDFKSLSFSCKPKRSVISSKEMNMLAITTVDMNLAKWGKAT